MGDNTLGAFASDFGCLKGWCQLATGSPPGRTPESLLINSLPYLWDPVKRGELPAHGMPADIEAGLRAERLLRASGRPDTVRRLTS